LPFFLADFDDGNGGPSSVCPRQLLKTVLGRAAARGWQFLSGVDTSGFNFRETPQTFAAKTLRSRNRYHPECSAIR
jgi:glutamine synthetase